MKTLIKFFRIFAGIETICGLLFHIYVIFSQIGQSVDGFEAFCFFGILFMLGGELLLGAYVATAWGKADEVEDDFPLYLFIHLIWWFLWIYMYKTPVPMPWE